MFIRAGAFVRIDMVGELHFCQNARPESPMALSGCSICPYSLKLKL